MPIIKLVWFLPLAGALKGPLGGTEKKLIFVSKGKKYNLSYILVSSRVIKYYILPSGYKNS